MKKKKKKGNTYNTPAAIMKRSPHIGDCKQDFAGSSTFASPSELPFPSPSSSSTRSLLSSPSPESPNAAAASETRALISSSLSSGGGS
jgi:hypothetical protein